MFFFFKQKTAYEMRISDWSSDVCSSDLFGDLRKLAENGPPTATQLREIMHVVYRELPFEQAPAYREMFSQLAAGELPMVINCTAGKDRTGVAAALMLTALDVPRDIIIEDYALSGELLAGQRFSENGGGMLSHMSARSEEHTSELQSLMRNAYAVF